MAIDLSKRLSEVGTGPRFFTSVAPLIWYEKKLACLWSVKYFVYFIYLIKTGQLCCNYSSGWTTRCWGLFRCGWWDGANPTFTLRSPGKGASINNVTVKQFVTTNKRDIEGGVSKIVTKSRDVMYVNTKISNWMFSKIFCTSRYINIFRLYTWFVALMSI